jgi:CubicO group peptidase (beta-lactamase class C family)
MVEHVYFPGPDPEWEQISPELAGFDEQRLCSAVDEIRKAETPWARDVRISVMEQMAEPPPYNEILGPTRERGEPNGLILRAGRIVAEWGDTSRVDMTFSASKSYLALCAGLAFDKGLLPDFSRPVRELIDDGNFDSLHNSRIIWEHLLQQTSEWEGTLWGKPDFLDRGRDIYQNDPQTQKGTQRELKEPGTFFEYNDVRVNVTSLALLRLWRKPLPEVLREGIMNCIGASSTWEWHGYRNSQVVIQGTTINSVPGGGHWGGGIFISSRDHARAGYLMLRKGVWKNTRLLSERFIELALTPSKPNPDYGYMIWLNNSRSLVPAASASSFFFQGAGANVVWVEPEKDLVVVFRWIRKDYLDEACRSILEALR